MRRWKRDCGAALAWAILVPTLAAADGLDERSAGWGRTGGDAGGVAWHRAPAPTRWRGPVLEHRRTSSRYRRQQESYLALKGGGLRLGDDPTTDGVFLGLEVGGAIEKVFEVGFSVDYYYRNTENFLVLDQSRVAQLPVQVVSSEHTSAHLLPLGLSLRLRLPTGDTISPFVSTTLAYEMLFLDNLGGSGDPWLEALATDETFTGWGVQTAAGLGVRLAPAVGLFAEGGYHWGSPSQDYVINGLPVELRVNMDGPFLRGGLRFGL